MSGPKQLEPLPLCLAIDCISALANLLFVNRAKTKSIYIYKPIQVADFLQSIQRKRGMGNKLSNHFLIVAYKELVSAVELNKSKIGEVGTKIFINQFKQIIIEIILLRAQINTELTSKQMVIF